MRKGFGVKENAGGKHTWAVCWSLGFIRLWAYRVLSNRCGIGSCGRCPSLADYVMGDGRPRMGATVSRAC